MGRAVASQIWVCSADELTPRRRADRTRGSDDALARDRSRTTSSRSTSKAMSRAVGIGPSGVGPRARSALPPSELETLE